MSGWSYIFGAKYYCLLLICLVHLNGDGSKQRMAVLNHTGPHFLKHLKPAMNLLPANVQKAVLINANAEQHHCSVLLYVYVRENVRV